MQVCRITDLGIGVCCCHETCRLTIGIVITGSLNRHVNSLPVCRTTDLVLSSCGHLGIMITGSQVHQTNGLPVCRTSDVFCGCFNGVLFLGSQNEVSN